MKGLVIGVVACVVGGLIGAAVWAALAYFAHVEVGWIAVGVGALCGFGMAVGTQGEAGAVGGAIAVVVALGSICVGKYAAVHFEIEKAMTGEETAHLREWASITYDDCKAEMARGVCYEMTDAGRTLKWPQDMDEETAEVEADFPKDAWKEMTVRWNRLSPSEQQQKYVELQSERLEAIEALKAEVSEEGFMASFSPFDLLWGFLAIGAAYKLGSGDGGD